MSKNQKKNNDYNIFSDNSEKSTSDKALEAMCPKMTYKQRLYGFCICAGIGWFLAFVSFISFFKGDSVTFAIMFTCGNIIAVGSTCFLSGPKDQAKKMIAPQRYISTIIFVVSMAFTLICALVIQIKPLTLLSALIQFCAYAWYSLSFIPFGQSIIKKACSSCLDA